MSGIVQLYSVDTTLTQCISAHAVTFARYRFEGNAHASALLGVAGRDCDSFGNGKVPSSSVCKTMSRSNAHSSVLRVSRLALRLLWSR